MTADWTNVTLPMDEPDEEPEYWEPWQPKVGDHVRIRLNGECRVEGEWQGNPTTERDCGYMSGQGYGHPEHANGRDGRVKEIWPNLYPGHPYRVKINCKTSPSGSHHGCFAAVELEPLSP